MTDDQTVESMRVMPNVRTLLADQGATFDEQLRLVPALLPVARRRSSPASTRTTTACGQRAAERRLRTSSTTRTRSRSGCSARATTTIHLGKYLNGYGSARPTEIPPGWAEWYGSVDPSTYQYYNYTLNENGTTVNYGTGGRDYQTDVYARKAVDAHRGAGARPGPFFLSLAFLAPHSGGPREPDDPAARHAVAGAAPPQRFAAEPLPIPPSFNEADVSDKPAGDPQPRRSSTPRADRRDPENYQQRLESLLAVDEAVARDRGRARRRPASSTTR